MSLFKNTGLYKKSYKVERREVSLTADVILLSLIVFFYFFTQKSSLAAAVSAILIITGYLFLTRLKKLLKRRRYLNSALSDIDRMSGKEFERWAKSFFEAKGYRVNLTRDTGDFGADLVMYKKTSSRLCREKTIVQVKRHKDRVGIDAVRQIAAAKAFYRADKCLVITNSYFTKSAKELALSNAATLIDRDDLMNIRA